MGNCCFLLQERKVNNTKKVDGEILQYHAPLKIHQVLSKLPDRAISGSQLDMMMAKMRHRPTTEAVAGDGVVRIKLVMTKQELKNMLSKEGMSLDDMMPFLRREASTSGPAEGEKCLLWQPRLDSIPEGNDSQ